MKRSLYALAAMSLLVFCSGCIDDLFTPEVGQKYRVTFEGNWTEGNHPTDFPSNDHFSDFIGVTHSASFSMFEEGLDIASAGLENMAETGGVTPLDEEILDIIQAGNGFDYITDRGVNKGDGDRNFPIFVDEEHPEVTIFTMIAPSPDWFCGVKNFSLLQNGNWIEETLVPVTVWDAGTDNGTTYTSEDSDTNPREPIQLLTAPPLGDGAGVTPPIGYFRFERR